jgi:hypothetical protein
MPETVRIFNPTPTRRLNAQQASLAPVKFKGAVIGFIDNAKPNFDHLVEDLTQLLASRHGIASAIQRRKRIAGIPSPQEIIQELTSQCGLVIIGSGD